jgi:hypothetical protein
MSVLSRATTRPVDTVQGREVVLSGLLALAALFVLYAMFLDQGGLLAPFFGADAFSANYLHEFAHDARHLLALPCH